MEFEKQDIRDYKDLLVWQKGINLVEVVYRITGNLPACEQWGLTSQMRRAAVSIPSNIAEGYGRQSTGNYKQFLSISRGSLLELETQIYLCVRLGYLNQNDAEEAFSKIIELNKMLSSLIKRIK